MDHKNKNKQPTETSSSIVKQPRRKMRSYSSLVTAAAMVAATSVNPAVSVSAADTCPFKELDFNCEGFKGGDYIGDLTQDYCVKITAIPAGSQGYAPGGKARLFNTQDPNQCDEDLGSPHVDFPGGIGTSSKHCFLSVLASLNLLMSHRR